MVKSDEFICRICGNQNNNINLSIKEMQIGTFEKFNYTECHQCKCIQINVIPKNLDSYYPKDYYSYSEIKRKTNKYFDFIVNWIKKRVIRYYTGKFNLVGFLTSFVISNPFPWMTKEMVSFNSKILDIGSGTGRLLYSMQRSGFTDLLGIDPYISNDILGEKGLKILKTNIFQLHEKFALIMLHHSFEHMDKPLEVMQKLAELIEDDGIILIRIPVTGGFAWRKYRENWYQLDAPRHIFIHSIESMRILSKKSNLEISNIIFDSNESQFVSSEKYQLGLTLFSNDLKFSKKILEEYKEQSKKLNLQKDGDMACFYLKKASSF